MIEEKDKQLLQVMSRAINQYLKAAGNLSDKAFDEMSKHNGLYWSELEEQKTTIEQLISEDNKKDEEIDNKKDEETDNKDKENAPLMLYNSMIEYLKKQKVIEHQWVKIYYTKCPQQDNKDFEIKYYEHKDPYAVHKNYILFGDTKKNYSIKRERGEVVGDTEKCLNYILNLRHNLGL
ncbi:hypothetical protein RBH29_04450 [Herbivorax sp. ANBcel31]|uniref:hypothetical protein n=1 Tax=Herbivorax sp. ANBcel31 TaxID=3069754 RepID=UPI0027B57F43|nr:hypothetical protein [Herbivorax sp. ANBcel31]MDQ2085684.1 hypothetical protein [Herbivorax sp. ANBcel31]